MSICLRRREFIAGLGGAAAWPLAARAQQRAVPVIGYLGIRSPGEDPDALVAFRQGLGEAGFVEGRNVMIEYRWAEFHNERFPALAADLVRRRVNVIAALSTPAALAAKAVTATIPIIFIADDPVELGLVASLNRPGGNLTGMTSLTSELTPKRLEVLRELLPAATVFALLVNPANPAAEAYMRKAPEAARSLGLKLLVLHASTEPEIEAAFGSVVSQSANALVIGGDSFFNSRTSQIAALALRHAVPTIYQYREFVAAGGLMSYGTSTSLADLARLPGTYTGRVLKGEKPADLPVQQATKVELFINLKTAKALGVTVPLTLRVRADEVIE
jgi:putative ABC transport system substrate-binding protein